MKIKLSEYHTEKVIYSNELHSSFEVESDIAEEIRNIDKEDYSLSLTEKWFNGIHITATKIKTKTVVDFLFESSHNHVSFLFCLEGSLNYYLPNTTTHLLTVKENQHNITLGRLNNKPFNVVNDTHFIYIRLTTAYYQKITNQNFTDHQKLFYNDVTTPEMSLLLKKLISHHYSGRAERIFLESKILGLMIFFIEKQTRKLTTVKTEDLNKILLAKKIVEENLQKPFSLIELSRKAGINDYKLKKGFKELTGFTVFGYIFKLRMENAHFFLLQERKQVNEVSFLVGYKNPQHFIAAFKKHFDTLPGSLNK